MIRSSGLAVVAILAALGAVALGTRPAALGNPAQPSVVIVADSITATKATHIRQRLAANGLDDVRFEARSGRRISEPVPASGGTIESGVRRVQLTRAAGIEPALWVVELGTNDLRSVRLCGCQDPVVYAGVFVDQMLDAIGPATPIAWVTVHDRSDYATTNTFNEALRRRAATNPYIRLIDWNATAMFRPDWFVDAMHPSVAGANGLGDLYAASFVQLLAEPPGPTSPQPGTQRAARLGHPTDPGLRR